MDQSAFKTRLAALNTEQREAVLLESGHALVLAGPGSGKTETLAMRIAYLLSRGVYPGGILCLTFTEAAAANMRARLVGLAGAAAYRVPIHTFHSFSSELIGRNPEYFYEGASFSPADDLVRISLLQDIFRELSHDDPLRAEHSEQGFVYLKPAQSAISQLKKAGMTPLDFEAFLGANAVSCDAIDAGIAIFDERLSAKRIPAIRAYADSLLSIGVPSLEESHHAPLLAAVHDSLSRALDVAEEGGKTASLSDWKERFTRKDDGGVRVFKDSAYLPKLASLCRIYASYRARMHEKGLYDFDDMILDVLEAFRTRPGFKAIIAERYSHILVDEFQDTNEAQMGILDIFSGDIMAVGDDDQAIYKFQGAEVRNLLGFTRRFPDARIISFSSNYRSHEAIVLAARRVAAYGTSRLEGFEGSGKKGSHAARGAGGEIVRMSFPTPLHEYAWVAEEIRRLIISGIEPNSIAVVAREHKQLEALQTYCAAAGVPVSYERLRDALLDPLVRQLLTMAAFADSVARQAMPEADDLLPQILSFPFWGFNRQAVWEISVYAHANRMPWLAAMRAHSDVRFAAAADFLIEAGGMAKAETADRVIDFLLNGPFRAHYFSAERLRDNGSEYAIFLSGIAAFMRALREHRRGEFVTVRDCLAFVALHERNGIPIPDTSFFVSASNAVHMASVHKIKGLEFPTVFVVGCTDSVWARPGRGSLLPFPANLPISPEPDSPDDCVRLLYVAMTRAEKSLYLTSYEKTEGGRSAEPLRFLADIPSISGVSGCPPAAEILSVRLSPPPPAAFAGEERAFLDILLPDYRLSVTHLNTFLNVASGGPHRFLDQCLLRFPQAKSPSASYGSAMHAAIEVMQARFKASGALPSLEDVLGFFENALSRERLAPHDMKPLLGRGKKALASFYAARRDSFGRGDLIETNFKHEGVLVSGASLTGKIDRIALSGVAGAVAHDLKTGKPSASWDGKDMHKKILLHGYRRQLIFYKLLIERSRTFRGRVVDSGILNFMEPDKAGRIVDLPLMIDALETDRLERLIGVVWKRIQTLDFPDISSYPKDLSGIIAFEEDLLAGT